MGSRKARRFSQGVPGLSHPFELPPFDESRDGSFSKLHPLEANMATSFPILAIGDIAVRQRNDLYCLNDLHKAAGNHAKQKPSEWLRNQQAKDLVAEISKAGIPTFETKRGNGAGIYAGREMVIGYAAWISAAFHLKVIRVFLDAVQPARPFNPALDYDRISPAQKQDLKEIVHAIAKAGIQKYDETWARLHNKFRVNAYHELPATRYEDARAYLLGKLPEDTCTTMTPTPQPLSADRARAAFDAATRAAGEVQRTVFDAVMSGNDDWKHQRLLLAFVTDSAIAAPAYVRPIESGSLIATWARLIEDIRHGECLNSTADLFEMASACMQRLSTRQQTSAKALVL